MDFDVTYQGRSVPFPSKSIKNAAARLTPANLRRMLQFGEQEMRKYLNRVTTELAQRHGNPYPGGTTATTLSRRSGRGLASLKNFRVSRTGTEVTGQMRLNKYMAKHEHGGWIRARNAKYLTIPLPAALNANGTPKRASARDWDNTFVIRSRNKNLLIVRKNRQGGITPLYVLKKSVRIPARLGLRKELQRQRPEMRRNIQMRIRELITLQRRR